MVSVRKLTLAQACFLLLCGRLADLYGRKRVWLAGYFILAVFAVGDGFAQCMCSLVSFVRSICDTHTSIRTAGMVLDIVRGIQGLGSAALIPASVGIILLAYPFARRDL